MSKFKIGDIIKGRKSNGYSVTTDKAIMKVVEINDEFAEGIRVEVLKHETRSDRIGKKHWVDEKKFDLFDSFDSFDSFDLVESTPISIKEPTNTEIIIGFDAIKVVEENGVTYLTINNKFTIAVKVPFKDMGISSTHSDVEEVGKALAFYKLMKGGR